MNKHEFSIMEARKYLLFYQGLFNNQYYGEKGVIKYIQKVGCIQYDPLNIVARNADLVLQSRVCNYTSDILHKLLYQSYELIDGWDKMMAIYSINDWINLKYIRDAKKSSMLKTMNYRNTMNALNYLDTVKEFIKRHGPCYSKDLKIIKEGSSKWGSNNLCNVALEYLFNIGELAVVDKNNSQKKYDLIERVISKKLLDKQNNFQNKNDFIDWYIIRKINSVGFYWNRNGPVWENAFTKSKKDRTKYINNLVDAGTIIPFTISGIDEVFYITKENLEIMKNINKIKNKKKCSILAPLDNLLWDREFIKLIFNFEYKWEVYTPKELRKYGYYVLPILYDLNFVARFEAKRDDKRNRLFINNWWWENKQYEKDIEIIEQIQKCLNNFLKFLNLADIEYSTLMKEGDG